MKEQPGGATHALVLYWMRQAFLAGYRGSVGVTGFDAEAEREFAAWLASGAAEVEPADRSKEQE